jgi:hypothetical protein
MFFFNKKDLMFFNFVKKWKGKMESGGKASNKRKLSKKNAEFRVANIHAKTVFRSNGCPARNGGWGGGIIMDQITIKTPNPKCRLYLCLIEFIDWRYSQSFWHFFDSSCELVP